MNSSGRARRSEAAHAAAATAQAADLRFAEAVARLVPLAPGLYAFGLADAPARREPGAGLTLPAVHIGALPHGRDAIEISDTAGRPAAWLNAGRQMLLVKAAAGGMALVTAYFAREPDGAPLAVDVRRIGGDARSGELAAMTLRMERTAAKREAAAALEVVAHIRGRGDVRFVDAPWVGRVGSGAWIEAFTILPRDPATAGAIEYKGLTASGAETPWLGCGAPCGTTGRGMPLLGFAIRQKAVAGGARFDCEYSGYFQSGATGGPARNGAPCRSPQANDPLEGIQLRITPRPGRSNPDE